MEKREVAIEAKSESVRLLARQLGRMLNDDELDAVAGAGGCTCTGSSGGDCDGQPL